MSKQAMEISLSKGMTALIDEDDIPLIAKYKWYVHKGNSATYAAITYHGEYSCFGEKQK